MQVTESGPARVIEDVLPIMMNYQDFFVSGSIWKQFHEKFLTCTFSDFWWWKLRRYDLRNSLAREFLSISAKIGLNTIELCRGGGPVESCI